jgi:uncharacterized Zn-finger protein
LTWKDLLDNGWFVRVVLVLWLVSAVFVVFLLGRIDWVVHHELYNYGLQFSLEWASYYWSVLRIIYMFLAVPIFLSVAYFGFEVWRFFRDRGVAVRRKPLQPSKPVSRATKALEQNHMLISCPKCKKVFSKPLVMLDFSSGKTRLVNVCPYCNHVLGSAEEAGKEDVGVFDLEKKKVEN